MHMGVSMHKCACVVILKALFQLPGACSGMPAQFSKHPCYYSRNGRSVPTLAPDVQHMAWSVSVRASAFGTQHKEVTLSPLAPNVELTSVSTAEKSSLAQWLNQGQQPIGGWKERGRGGRGFQGVAADRQFIVQFKLVLGHITEENLG